MYMLIYSIVGTVGSYKVVIVSLEQDSNPAAASLCSFPPVPRANPFALSSSSFGAESALVLEGRAAFPAVRGAQRTAVSLPALPRFAEALPGP
jgi:hypothetical protein